MVEVTRDLSIQFTIRNKSIHIHSMPIRYEVFETYYKPISLTFSEIYNQGLDYAFGSGPRIAALSLKEHSQKLGVWDTPDGVKNGLISEIHRLTNVVVVASPELGWQTFQFSDVLRKNFLTPREVSEVEGILVFFTCVSVMQTQDAAPLHLKALSLWNVQTTSSNVTALCDSLRTLTKEDDSIKKTEVSSLPS